MKKIELTRGEKALVDDEDYIMLTTRKWSLSGCRNNVYAANKLLGQMHRLLMGLSSSDKRQVDHINGNTLDNRRENLRVCTLIQNKWNRRPNKGKKYKGVRRSGNMWSARIQVWGTQTHLGMFNTEKEAAKAYNEAAKKYHGAFAYQNKV